MLNSDFLKAVKKKVREALKEDLGTKGDITSLSVVPLSKQGKALIVAKARGIVAGLPVAEAVFTEVDSTVSFTTEIDEGAPVKENTIIAEIRGKTHSLLTAERTALNFLQRLSGIATLTRAFVNAAGKTGARILDTRKTTPGLRILEKYAVRVGGGENHRMCLSDMVLVKDNHMRAAGSLREAVVRVLAENRQDRMIEVEVKTLDELKETLELGIERIMLDNMSIREIRRAVHIAKGKAILEASGGIDLRNVKAVAETGVDCISVGALTHSAPALDISMELVE